MGSIIKQPGGYGPESSATKLIAPRACVANSTYITRSHPFSQHRFSINCVDCQFWLLWLCLHEVAPLQRVLRILLLLLLLLLFFLPPRGSVFFVVAPADRRVAGPGIPGAPANRMCPLPAHVAWCRPTPSLASPRPRPPTASKQASDTPLLGPTRTGAGVAQWSAGLAPLMGTAQVSLFLLEIVREEKRFREHGTEQGRTRHYQTGQGRMIQERARNASKGLTGRDPFWHGRKH